MDEPRFRRKFRLNKKIAAWIAGVFSALALAAMVFFFSFFQVKNIEVRGSTRYSDEEVKEMVLKGLFAENSVLAPIFCSKDNVKDVFFVDGYSVTQMSRDTIAINVREKKPVGCIPFLDSYIYFDRNGFFVEGSRNREDKVPYFNGIEVKQVVEDEKLGFRGTDILNTAVTLSTIFQKEQKLPDHVEFDSKGQITLVYGMITVNLGENKYLEDKMARAIAILPKIQGRKGILHLESVKDNSKIVTFEPLEMTEEDKASAEENGIEIPGSEDGGGTEEGTADGTADSALEEEDAARQAALAERLQYALYGWVGGYTEWGEFTGDGEYDSFGNHIGPYPTLELLESFGDWQGGFTQNGMWNGTGEYDHQGIYVGPNPNAEPAEEEPEEEESTDLTQEVPEESAGDTAEDAAAGVSEDAAEVSPGTESAP